MKSAWPAASWLAPCGEFHRGACGKPPDCQAFRMKQRRLFVVSGLRHSELHLLCVKARRFAMKVLALNHVQIAIPPAGEDRARAFYSVVLVLLQVTKRSSST